MSASIFSTSHTLTPSQRRFHSAAITALLALLAYLAYTGFGLPPIQLFYGLLIYVLAALPALGWTRSGAQGIPAFAIFSLAAIPAYAFPLLTGHNQLQLYPDDTLQRSAFGVLLFQMAMLAAYSMAHFRSSNTQLLTDELVTHKAKSTILGAYALSAIYTVVSIFTNLIPYSFASLAHAIFAGVTTICAFLLCRLWGRGELIPQEKLAVVALTTLSTLAQFSTLFLVSGISLLLLAFIGWIAGARRLPVIPLLVLIPILGILHNGKHVLREKYWTEEGHQQVSLSATPALFRDWVSNGLSLQTNAKEGRQDLSKALLERSSLFHMLCLVVDCTPYRQPYLHGDTYKDIPGQFVPRFLWPNKPLAHVSTYKLSVYYGLQREEDTVRTTIGFGFIPEAYANFGMIGLIITGALVGLGYRYAEDKTRDCPLVSAAGLFLILLTAWSFQTEFTLSIWLSSLTQACVAVIVIPVVFKRLFG